MKISTTEQYVKLTKALLKKGYTVDTVYEALESAGFSVSLKGETYEGIYASRVLAMMHDPKALKKAKKSKKAKPLEL